MKYMMKKGVTLFLICALLLCLGACEEQVEEGSSLPAVTPEVTAAPTPTATPSPAPSPTPEPTPTPTPLPPPTPVPVYRDITEADYETLFNESTSEEQIAYLIRYLPVGTYENGISAIAAKNVWESVYMTDNTSIDEIYDLEFINEGKTVTGDASKMFAWFGIVNNKGIYNDPADDSVTIEGSTLTIECSGCEHRDWYYPRIVTGKVSDNDLYLYYAYSTDYHSKAPNVHRTALFVKDETGKYQVAEITEREPGSVAPAKPEYNFSLISEQDLQSGNPWKSILAEGSYNSYVSEWPMDQTPSQYAILDIDGDGMKELVLSSNVDSIGFTTFAVLTYNAEENSIEPVMFQEFSEGEHSYTMCHNGLRFSEKYHALVYKRTNDGPMFGSFIYQTTQDGQQSELFTIGYSRMNGETEYTYFENGESTELTEDEYRSFLDEAAFVEFEPFE